jgi:hypothetical protein
MGEVWPRPAAGRRRSLRERPSSSLFDSDITLNRARRRMPFKVRGHAPSLFFYPLVALSFFSRQHQRAASVSVPPASARRTEEKVEK